MPEKAPTFVIEDARIIFSNFAGREGRYNKEGERDFVVEVPDALVKPLIKDGWNIKTLKPREEGDSVTPIISITVNFKIRPPRIVLITSTGQTHMTEDMVDILDWADIQMVDLMARGRPWDDNGKTRIKAYLKSLFVTIEETELDRKHAINR